LGLRDGVNLVVVVSIKKPKTAEVQGL